MLIPKYDNYVWQGWRSDILWTIEVDDLYRNNLAAMKKLHKFYNIKKKTKTYYLADAVEMFCVDCPLDLLPDVICNAWGLSMQTVCNDIT